MIGEVLHEWDYLFHLKARLASKEDRENVFLLVQNEPAWARAFGKQLVAILAEGEPADGSHSLPQAVAAAGVGFVPDVLKASRTGNATARANAFRSLGGLASWQDG